MQIACKIKDADVEIGKYINSSDDIIDEFEEEVSEDHRITARAYKISVPDLNLYLREGTLFNFDESDGEYKSDFDLVLVYNADNDKREYWEQDVVIAVLYNYCVIAGINVDDIENLDCYIEFPGM